MLEGCWGGLWTAPAALPASLTHHSPALPTPSPPPVSLVAPGKQLQSVGKAGREPRASPARHCPAAEGKLLVWAQERWRLVVPSTACSHMAAPGASWHSPQQILLVQLHPLSCLFDVSLALVPAPVPIPTAISHGQAVVVSPVLSRPSHSSRMGQWGYICSLHRVLSGSETPGTKQPAFMPLNHLAPQTQRLCPNPLACCSGSCHGQLLEMRKAKESKKCILWWGALPGNKDQKWRT